MEKAYEIQKQIRNNGKTLNSYMTDLQSWEAEMKRKEAALSGESDQALPPVRSRAKKEKPVLVKPKPEPRISASDYCSWEKFDVDKACEDIDMEGVGPSSLDGKKSQAAKMEKLRDEAQHEKERGNNFVKQEKWDEAISCYNRAIELVKDDAIYYANRGLCHLKKDRLHQAETDCSEALRLAPEYVKALQRRAAARERLGALRAASADLAAVLRLEPRNKAAQAQLEVIKARMGTKGAKSKSSPSTPTETKSLAPSAKIPPKIVELDSPKVTPEQSDENWKNGVDENVTVLRPVKKPPHLRSKRALKTIPIQEIHFGKSKPSQHDKVATRLKITEVDSEDAGQAGGDTPSPESGNLASHATAERSRVTSLVPPVNSVQFMAEWKYLKGRDDERSQYLSIIDPSKIPSIFANALESDVLSELLRALHTNSAKFQHGVASYLSALAKVKRFCALAMFLTAQDQQMISDLLEYCKNVENCNDDVITDLKKKYEL